MFKLKINTEEKTLQSEKHKKFSFTFEKQANDSLLKHILKLIQSWLKK